MADQPDERIQGVDTEDLNAVLEDVSYPITVDELIEQRGEREIERTNAEPITIRELFEPMGGDTFESTDEVRQMVLTLMPRESVGRPQYSDRGGSHPVESSEAERQDQDESV